METKNHNTFNERKIHDFFYRLIKMQYICPKKKTSMDLNYLKELDVFSIDIISLLLIAGFLTGFVNTIAGSGTVIAYSIFMFLGLPVGVANGTVRMGVIMQTLAAAFTFYKKKVMDFKKGVLISIPITIGSIIGAQIAVSLDKDLFEKIIAVVMIIMLFFVFYKPEKWINGKAEISEAKPKFWHYLIYFIIGIYGGFIHIGVGIFLLAALVLVSGYDLVRANALKILTVFFYSPFAFAVFILNDQVDYSMGLITSVGNLAGGIIASHIAVKRGANFIRWILIAIMVLFAGYLLKVF